MMPRWAVGGLAVVVLAGVVALWLGRGPEVPSNTEAPSGASSAILEGSDVRTRPLEVAKRRAEQPIVAEAGAQIPQQLQTLVKGSPAPGAWVEDVPEGFDEASFTETIEDLLDDCDSEYRIVDMACDEAPCMVAWTAPVGADHPAACPKWASTYGSRTITKVAFDVDCPDGRRVRAELATPHDALLKSVDDPHSWNGGRMAHRATAYSVSDWCR